MAESFNFWTRVQKDNEIITHYSLTIKKLTVHANFPDLNRWLRDRFVTGLNHSHAAVQENEPQQLGESCGALTVTSIYVILEGR